MSGKQAITKSSNENVRVILMDIKMPGKIDGIDAATRISKMYPDKPIIFTSAFCDDYSMRIKTAGLDKFKKIDKPLTSGKVNFLVNLIKDSIKSSNEPQIVQPFIYQLDNIDPRLYQVLRNDPKLMKTLDWRLFEKLLADILETFGYKIENTRGTKDGGIDIFALIRAEDFGIHKYILQAKRWSNKVGVEPVQRLLFLHSKEKASKSCLATTSLFTSGAWKLCEQYKWQLELRDFNGLKDWIERAYRLKKGL